MNSKAEAPIPAVLIPIHIPVLILTPVPIPAVPADPTAAGKVKRAALCAD